MRAISATPARLPSPAASFWWATVVVALGAMLVVGGGGLVSMVGWWQRPEGSHGWVIPFVVGFILWQRRERIRAAGTAPSWWGVVIVALGLALLLVDEVGQLQRVAVPAMVIMLLGGVVAGLGWRAARYMAVPLALLMFAVPPPGPLYVQVSLELQFLSSALGAAILRLLGVTVFLDGNIIDLGVYRLQVVEACSGLRYLFPLGFFAFLCAWVYRAPLWAKAIVLVSVVPITILTNSARIAVTGLFVQFGSIEHAEGFMHLFEGWVIFLIALAMLCGVMWLLARLRGVRGGAANLLDFDRLAGLHVPRPAADERVHARRTVTRAPWLVSLALVLAAVPAHALLMNREQVIPERPGLVTLPIAFGEWQGQPWTIDARTEEILGASDYFLGDFVHAGSGASVNLWIAYYEEQVRQAVIHTPEQCLPGGGWEFVTLERVPAPTTNATGGFFEVNRAVISNSRQQMLVYYWLEARGGQFAGPQRFKFANVRASLIDGRSDGGLVRLITPIEPGETEEDAESRLVDFMTAAYPAFEPHLGR